MSDNLVALVTGAVGAKECPTVAWTARYRVDPAEDRTWISACVPLVRHRRSSRGVERGLRARVEADDHVGLEGAQRGHRAGEVRGARRRTGWWRASGDRPPGGGSSGRPSGSSAWRPRTPAAGRRACRRTAAVRRRRVGAEVSRPLAHGASIAARPISPAAPGGPFQVAQAVDDVRGRRVGDVVRVRLDVQDRLLGAPVPAGGGR